MERLFAFIEGICEEYNIDESHDVRHSKDCMDFAEKLMDHTYTDEERKMIRYAAALHDCVDKKYTPVEEASKKVYDFLIAEEWDSDMADALLRIINTMSYSYLQTLKTDMGNVYPEHGSWQRAYHTVRQADLLCSYRVDRCYHYQKRLDPTMAEYECWKKVDALFQKRVFRYVADMWLTSRAAHALVPGLIHTACEILERRAL
jgi:HD superfamily phosphodiesterase